VLKFKRCSVLVEFYRQKHAENQVEPHRYRVGASKTVTGSVQGLAKGTILRWKVKGKQEWSIYDKHVIEYGWLSVHKSYKMPRSRHKFQGFEDTGGT
jgi:hypothetical protein